MNLDEELISAKSKETLESCCKSYLETKGRCFDCPDWNNFNQEDNDQINY